VIFEKNYSLWQGERNLGGANLRRKEQSALLEIEFSVGLHGFEWIKWAFRAVLVHVAW
jgi:hypothetical protein